MTKYKEQLIATPYQDSRLGNQNFIQSSRVGLLFTARAGDNTEYDTYNPEFITGGDTAQSEGTVGFGYGAAARKQIPGADNGRNREILVGAGWRSVNIEQQNNVTQEGGLGHHEILETLIHSVASNTMSADKMALRVRMLNRIGIAPFGKDVLASPFLNCYIYDPKERQRGADFGYLKCFGLTIATNRLSSSNGSGMMESVSFKVDRFQRIEKIPEGLISRLAERFPQIYTDLEQLQTFNYVDVVADGTT